METNSDSDDEDKLHIVEEESITDAADCEGGVPEDELPTDPTVLPGRGEREGSSKNCWEDDGNLKLFVICIVLILFLLKYWIDKLDEKLENNSKFVFINIKHQPTY